VVSLLASGMPLETAEDLAQEVWIRLIQQQREGRLQELRLPGLAIAQAAWFAREAQRTQRRR
jgi:RNA polymerase sigma-70 factor (ECF subfamily)